MGTHSIQWLLVSNALRDPEPRRLASVGNASMQGWAQNRAQGLYRAGVGWNTHRKDVTISRSFASRIVGDDTLEGSRAAGDGMAR